jgi:iron uptake system component EfeO
MKPRTLHLTAFLALCVALCAGCGGDSGGSGGAASTQRTGAADSVAAQAAGDRYRRYLADQTALLVDRTQAFAKAVIFGNVEQAKSLYAEARMPYERVEPVAESFGGLDPEIDGREDTVPPSSFVGFHRIEKALWQGNSAKGVRFVATDLLADVKRLRALVFGIGLSPGQIANGANELLTEVSTSKITGEEERYSHTDLWDFEANVQGSKAAFDAVNPILKQVDPSLSSEIEQQFADVEAALGPYRRGNGFVSYGELTEQDKRKLSQSIDALAEPLSQVAARIAPRA